WMTLAVQLGFVAGTLVSALANLPDVLPPSRLVVASALLRALANATLAPLSPRPSTAPPLRLLPGVFLARVYPPAVKILATWFRSGRGLALGVLVGALTLGKAFPYLVNAVGGASWRRNMLAVSGLAAVGAILVAFAVREGPYSTGAARFDITQAARVFQNR